MRDQTEIPANRLCDEVTGETLDRCIETLLTVAKSLSCDDDLGAIHTIQSVIDALGYEAEKATEAKR